LANFASQSEAERAKERAQGLATLYLDAIQQMAVEGAGDDVRVATAVVAAPAESTWWKVGEAGCLAEGARLQTCVEGRYVTVFRSGGELSCIDAICHHAGGPLTVGELQDIEELGVTVVLCPWHKFMVDIKGGLKAYKSVEIQGGKPTVVGWRLGKVVQRPHLVRENEAGQVFVSLVITDEPCTSDTDSYSARCGAALGLSSFEPVPA